MIGKILITVFLMLSINALGKQKCVNLYYDLASKFNTSYSFGRTHVLFLQNLLGHFPQIQQYVMPIEKYKKGDLEKCDANIYIGTYYDNPVPKEFINDFVLTSRNVVWAGYNIWQLGDERLKKLWNMRFLRLSTLDWDHLDSKARPGFFKNFDYKGEIFFKYGEFDKKDSSRFNAAYEISLFELLVKNDDKHVLSWAGHSTQDLKAPYILNSSNHWVIADSPFSFMHEEDRYLIFADLLFDILKEAPIRQSHVRPALIRIEDVHPKIPLWQLRKLTKTLTSLNIPFSISIIPIFADPMGVTTQDPSGQFVPITAEPDFVKFLKSLENVSFIFHGVTHQYGLKPNAHNGLTGCDFEFWDAINNRPLSDDSTINVLRRLMDGMKLLKKAGINPVAWLTPHYQASPLDYVMFGQLFKWNLGRVIYFPFFNAHQFEKTPSNLTFDGLNVFDEKVFLKYFSNLWVEYASKAGPNGQFFPYEIYGDIYEQRLIPENVGNLQPYLNEHVHKAATVDTLLAILKRNRVLRDVWGSFFLHPLQLDGQLGGGVGAFPGDVREIERLVTKAKSFGYEFIDLKTWVLGNHEIRPKPTEGVTPHE